MNISEHLALFVKHQLKCSTVFTLTGGGAMFLNDAFGNTEGLRCIYNHHEQAAAMSAVGFSKLNGIGVCVTTTGCGATNAITGLLDAWQDSQPVLFISGQVKKKETTHFSGLSLRSFGVQELDIAPIVGSLTKKVFCLGTKDEYFEFLQQVPHLLYEGRPGPVWVDIPMDLQSLELTQSDLSTRYKDANYDLSLGKNILGPNPSDLAEISQALSHSKRPVFLVGNGLRLSNCGKGISLVDQYCLKNSIPIVSTYLGADFFPESFTPYLGVCGLKAARRANIALYNADLVIAIGSRLATSVIGFEYDKFAPEANIFVVDIDEIEHSKKTRLGMRLILSDAYSFLLALASLECPLGLNTERKNWFDSCCKMRELLPVQEQFSPPGAVSIYDVVKGICENCGEKDVLVSDAGSAYYVSSIMFKRKSDQRYVTSGAQADMGFSLPASIGVAASIEPSFSRVHAVTGDGSFQLNIQEIQTLVTNRLPVTLYVLNNNGYLSIRATQSSFFPGRQCGTDPKSGVDFPNIEILCAAYQIEYRHAADIETLRNIIIESNECPHPMICEVLCPHDEAIIPRTKTIKNADGSLESAPLCSMQPDLNIDIKKELNSLGLVC